MLAVSAHRPFVQRTRRKEISRSVAKNNKAWERKVLPGTSLAKILIEVASSAVRPITLRRLVLLSLVGKRSAHEIGCTRLAGPCPSASGPSRTLSSLLPCPSFLAVFPLIRRETQARGIILHLYLGQGRYREVEGRG